MNLSDSIIIIKNLIRKINNRNFIQNFNNLMKENNKNLEEINYLYQKIILLQDIIKKK